MRDAERHRGDDANQCAEPYAQQACADVLEQGAVLDGSIAALPTAPTDGKTRGLTWNSGTTIAQTITSTSSGAMNMARPRGN
jgi:hypothetical protein